MNIALLFAGRIKYYDLHKETYDTILKNNTVDIFLSTNPELNEDISNFIELYNPIHTINEPNININIEYKDIDFNKFKLIHPIECIVNYIPALYNKKMVFNIFETYLLNSNKKYDYVILHRLDIPGYEINFNDFDKDDNTINIAYGNDFGGLNDRIIIGTVNAIKKYTTIYDNIIKYLNDGCAYHGESVNKFHIEKMGFNIKRFNYPTNIKRN